MVLVSFRAHIISGVINLIATVLTGVALFTCSWVDLNISIFGGSGSASVGISSTCGNQKVNNSGSVNVTLAFIIMAFIFQIFGLLHLLGTSAYRKFNQHVLKVDTGLTTLSLLCLITTITVFGIWSANDLSSGSYSLGYSYILACVATGVALLAYLPVAHAYHKIRRHGDCDCEYFEY